MLKAIFNLIKLIPCNQSIKFHEMKQFITSIKKDPKSTYQQNLFILSVAENKDDKLINNCIDKTLNLIKENPQLKLEQVNTIKKEKVTK